jgi:hypothetical protein
MPIGWFVFICVQKLTIIPNKAVLGKHFRKEAKILSESLEVRVRFLGTFLLEAVYKLNKTWQDGPSVFFILCKCDCKSCRYMFPDVYEFNKTGSLGTDNIVLSPGND